MNFSIRPAFSSLRVTSAWMRKSEKAILFSLEFFLTRLRCKRQWTMSLADKDESHTLHLLRYVALHKEDLS